jgi:hypothetical protein
MTMKKLMATAFALVGIYSLANAAQKKQFKCRQDARNCACYNEKSSDECRNIYKGVSSCVQSTESLPECKK